MESNQSVVGILAHVDAGKTTLSEALLYTAGTIRKLGRVDHKDAFLDTFQLERERGITIFSKQARFSWKEREFILLDTPGHVDFGAETERTLQVLDYCILVISASDGVQGHTETLWKLLKRYHVPTILFVNKMDQPDTDREKLLSQLKARLSEGCVGFASPAEEDDTEREAFLEEVSLCDERLLNEYLEKGVISPDLLAEAVAERKLFPCFFGSALRLWGVTELMDGLATLTLKKKYPEEFGARVYKISRDPSGKRLTHLKITGGSLRAKMMLDNRAGATSPDQVWQEKVDILRICDGAGYEMAEQVDAGGICAVTGLSRTFAGQGLGYEGESRTPLLTPVLTYKVNPPEGVDEIKILDKLRQLEEEDPLLRVEWREALREIHVCVMGEVQLDVIESLMRERFGMEVTFDSGKLLYKETIATSAEGIGHFEPLRHYAEVHLYLEPGEPGSGIGISVDCSVDELDKNWQRLIVTHLEEKTHLGVLTGSPLTDVKITLLTGRAHIKHTEGGDFRQATYRAVRQALMQCESVLLEPVYAFTLEVPVEQIGRAMSDIRRLYGTFEDPVTEQDMCILRGKAPVATLGDYQREVNAYTRGRGRISYTLSGYEPCHNTEEVVCSIGYDPEKDTENPSSSVFCAHGAGFVVTWDQVPEYAHVESNLSGRGEGSPDASGQEGLSGPAYTEWEASGRRRQESQTGSGRSDYITKEEIQQIFKQSYRKSVEEYEPYRYHQLNTGGILTGQREQTVEYKPKQAEPRESYFLVDGYNIIFAWEELRSLAEVNLDSARDKLMDICCNFQGYHGATLILVFDAYKVKGNPGSVQKYHNIYVVYTKEAETADQYIEKTVHKIGGKYRVTVATSDALEQMIIWGAGAVRLSAGGFLEAIQEANRGLKEISPKEQRLGNKICIPDSKN